jgi:hypothetical protein
MNYSRPISDISDFEDKLHSAFRGRLRIRWSLERGEWHIEQRVKRGLFAGQRPTKRGWDETHDRYIQNRDGVILIMSIRTGDRMPCPRCGSELKVPYYETHHVKCELCSLRGKPKHVAAVYMPLGDKLIGYLKSIDPENPISESLAEDLDRQNMALAASMERDALRESEAAFHLNYNRVVGIPEWGYAGMKRFQG